MPQSPHRSGFTLIELLVVVTIIAIIAALLLSGFTGTQDKARDLTTTSRMTEINSAIQGIAQQTDKGVATVLSDGFGFSVRLAPIERVVAYLARSDVGGGSLWNNRAAMPPNMSYPGGDRQSTDDIRTILFDYGNTRTRSRDMDEFSIYGERRETTMEVYPGIISPDAPTNRNWYLEQWPVEWPSVDWRSSEDVVVWGTPWGATRLKPGGQLDTTTNSDGDEVPRLDNRTVADLSPLRTMQLLQLANAIPNGTEGEDEFRDERSKNKPYNDAYGSPIIVASGVYFPRRHDQWNNPAESTGLARDQYYDWHREAHGYSRGGYLAMGSIGNRAPTDPADDSEVSWSGSWTASEDNETYRQHWNTVTNSNTATDWADDGFGTPPWTGMRVVRDDDDDEVSYLFQPTEIK